MSVSFSVTELRHHCRVDTKAVRIALWLKKQMPKNVNVANTNLTVIACVDRFFFKGFSYCSILQCLLRVLSRVR